jgi:hypothetical protein
VSKLLFAFILILLFWSQLNALENRFRLKTFGNFDNYNLNLLRIYMYMNIFEYLLTVFYHAFIILLYDKLHKPNQEQVNHGIYYQQCRLRKYQIAIAWGFNIGTQTFGCYALYNSNAILLLEKEKDIF